MNTKQTGTTSFPYNYTNPGLVCVDIRLFIEILDLDLQSKQEVFAFPFLQCSRRHIVDAGVFWYRRGLSVFLSKGEQ